MKPSLTFTSPDEGLTDYYEWCFKDWFTRELVQVLNAPQDLMDEVIILELKGIWNRRMLLEAEIQEHFAFDEVEVDGKKLRVPQLSTEDNRPILLIPTIEVSAE